MLTMLILLLFSFPLKAQRASQNPLAGIGDGRSGFSNGTSVNPMTLSQQLGIDILKLSGRAGMDLEVKLVYGNNFWSAVQGSYIGSGPGTGNNYVQFTNTPFSTQVPGGIGDASPLPQNNLGGWKLISPAGHRLFVYFNFATGAAPYPRPYRCVLTHFMYQDASGTSTAFFPGAALPNHPFNCDDVVMTDTRLQTILSAINTVSFYPAKGNGSRLQILSATENIQFGTAARTGTVIRVTNSGAHSIDFALFSEAYGLISAEGAGHAEGVVVGFGMPFREMDRFGNRNTMSYSIQKVSTNTSTDYYTVSQVDIRDSLNRLVTIEYDATLRFPNKVTAKQYYDDSSDLVTNFTFESLVFDHADIHSCATVQSVDLSAGLPASFATLKTVVLPNNRSWTFGYDRGWGTSGTTKKSDGSIAKVTTPYGQEIDFEFYQGSTFLNAQSTSAYTKFLSPSAYYKGHCARTGLVNKVSYSATSGGPGYVEDYQFSPSNTSAPTQVTISKSTKDELGDTKNYQEMVFESRLGGIDFVEIDNTTREAAGGAIFSRSQKTHQCEQFNMGPPIGLDGHCWTTGSTDTTDGITTMSSSTMDLSQSRTIFAGGFFAWSNAGAVTLPRKGTTFLKNSAGTTIRKSVMTYISDPLLLTYNLLDLEDESSSYIVSGGVETLVSKTKTKYNEADLTQPSAGTLTQFSERSEGTYRPTSFLNFDLNSPADESKALKSRTQINRAGMTIQTINPDGTAVTLGYDPTQCGGNYPVTSANALNQVSTFRYFCNSGALKSTSDPNGNLTEYLYVDPLHRKTRETQKASNGIILRQVAILYDDVNRTTTTQVSNGSTIFQSTVTQFDEAGRSVSVTKSNPNDVTGTGATTTTGYDIFGRTEYTINPFGQKTKKTFDVLGRELKTIAHDGQYSEISYSGLTTSYRDSHGRYAYIEKDLTGKVIRVKQADGKETFYDYNAKGDLEQVRLPNSGQIHRMTYDGFGRVLTSRRPEYQTSAGTDYYYEVLEYDAMGRIKRAKTPMGYNLENFYDLLGRLQRTTFTQGAATNPILAQDIVNVYDNKPNSIGFLTSTCEGTTNCRELEYDFASRLQYETQRMGVATYETEYKYSAIGTIEQIKLPSGRWLTNTLNSSGNLTKASWQSDNGAIDFFVDRYDLEGKVESVSYPNGITTLTNYDPMRGQLTGISTGTPNSAKTAITAAIATFGLGYNHTPEKCASSGSETWNSAVSSTPATVSEMVNGASRSYTYTYDCLDRLASAQANTGSTMLYKFTYGFDDKYNRISQAAVSGTQSWAAAFASTATYDSYNHKSGYTYYPGGNIADDGKNTYKYDSSGRLVESTDKQTLKVTTYLYLGNDRIGKNSDGLITHYIRNNQGLLLSEYTSNLAVKVGESATFFHKDYLGSTRLVTNVLGLVKKTFNYLPYGEEEIQGSSTPTKKFAGHERDNESGNDFMGARYYSSRNGTFLTLDPLTPVVENPMTWNGYNYASSNPIGRIDPNGMADTNANTQEESWWERLKKKVKAGFAVIGASQGYDPISDFALMQSNPQLWQQNQEMNEEALQTASSDLGPILSMGVVYMGGKIAGRFFVTKKGTFYRGDARPSPGKTLLNGMDPPKNTPKKATNASAFRHAAMGEVNNFVSMTPKKWIAAQFPDEAKVKWVFEIDGRKVEKIIHAPQLLDSLKQALTKGLLQGGTPLERHTISGTASYELLEFEAERLAVGKVSKEALVRAEKVDSGKYTGEVMKRGTLGNTDVILMWEDPFLKGKPTQ